MSDQDADAEMDVDDEFSQMHTPVAQLAPMPAQHAPQLEVQRIRGPAQRMATGGANFVNGNRAVSHSSQGGGTPDMSQPMPNVHPSMYGHHGHHPAHSGMASMGVKRDPMYLE